MATARKTFRFIVAPSGGGGSLPAWVSALSPGSWTALPGTAMSGIQPSPTPPGNTGPSSKVGAWTSFVVDPETSMCYSVANGGHADYAGNEVDRLVLDTAAPYWEARLAPTPTGSLASCQSYYSDGRPTSRHSYYGVTYEPVNRRFMLFGGAWWCGGGGFHGAISSYNINSNSYSASNAHPGSVSGGVWGMCSNPDTGDVYMFRDWFISKWTRSSNSYAANVSPSGSAPYGNESPSAFDSSRGRILVIGGTSNDRHVYTVGTNTVAQITLSGSAAGSVQGSARALMYIPALDAYLVRGSGSGGTVYRINAANWECTTFTTSGGGSVPSTPNGPYNKFLYVPKLNGCVYVPAYGSNAWFLRVH